MSPCNPIVQTYFPRSVWTTLPTGFVFISLLWEQPDNTTDDRRDCCDVGVENGKNRVCTSDNAPIYLGMTMWHFGCKTFFRSSPQGLVIFRIMLMLYVAESVYASVVERDWRAIFISHMPGEWQRNSNQSKAPVKLCFITLGLEWHIISHFFISASLCLRLTHLVVNWSFHCC